MKPCTVCGCAPDTNIVPGVLRDLRLLLGPKWRATVDGLTDRLCWTCQSWAARFVGITL